MGDGYWVLGRRKPTPNTYHPSPLRSLAPICLDLAQEPRRLELLPTITAGGPGEMQPLAGARHGHIAQPALLLDPLGRAQAAFVWQRTLLQAGHEDNRPLQPFGSVDGQQLNLLAIVLLLVHAGHQRNFLE